MTTATPTQRRVALFLHSCFRINFIFLNFKGCAQTKQTFKINFHSRRLWPPSSTLHCGSHNVNIKIVPSLLNGFLQVDDAAVWFGLHLLFRIDCTMKSIGFWSGVKWAESFSARASIDGLFGRCRTVPHLTERSRGPKGIHHPEEGITLCTDLLKQF